ncbi:MAG: hypothetical protein WC476_11885 [Phycisphaerae bacterium]|jgi:hypothetical protein
MSIDDTTTIPDESAVAEPQETPIYQQKIDNFADNKELAGRIWSYIKAKHSRYVSQTAREYLVKANGLMDIADKMYRVSLTKDTTSAQHQNTLSDVSSTIYHRAMNTLHAAFMRIFFPDEDELPASYEPDNNTDEYTMEEGQRIAKQHNALAFHTHDKDDRKAKFSELLKYLLLYAQQLIIHEWDRKLETKTVRKPVAFDDRGVPTQYEFEEVVKTTKDCPSFKAIDIKDAWWDTQIEDMDQQRCIIWRCKRGWEDLNAAQLARQIMNVGKLTQNDLYQGDLDEENVLEQRLDNADESATQEADGRFIEWNSFCRIPLSIKTTKSGKTKAKWDEKAAPILCWCTFAGQIDGAGLPLRIIKLPYNHGKMPAYLGHSHMDNKGSIHMGFANIVRPLYSQITTNLNQCIDNITLRNRKPFIADGPIHTRDLTFRSNKVIKISKGTTLKEIDIQDTTQLTIPLMKLLEEDVNDTIGAKRALQAEPIGSRASATAERQTLDQAMAPIDDAADYIAKMLVWIYKMDAELWQQYGDPERILKITHNNQIEEVNPATLYGPVNVKVTAINRFRNNAMARMEINSLIQNTYGFAKEAMGSQGKTLFWRKVFKQFKFLEDLNQIFPLGGDYDAQNRAKEEVYRMTIVKPSQYIEPKMDENQEAHISVEEPALRQYDMLPDSERDEDAAMNLRRHIEAEKQFLSQKSAPSPQQQMMSPAGIAEPGTGQPAGLQGELGGEAMGAVEGANVGI